MHNIAKNCLYYPSLKNLDFLKQYNYLQLYIHLYVKKKDNGTMISISKYAQSILRRLEFKFFKSKIVKLFFMIFHKANNFHRI
jgi:hypothetical protein